jgi:hypothetical protein
VIVDVLGTPVALHAPDPVAAELRRHLVDLPRAADAQRRVVLERGPGGALRLLDSGAVVQEDVAESVAAATIVWRLNAIASETSDHLLVHAGCVGGADGAPDGAGAVLLPGRSGTGKSTLTAACVRAGLAYLSDELAALDLDRGLVVPWAKPLGLDGEQLVAASRLRRDAVGAARPPAGIVFPRYQPGAATETTRLDPAWAFTALAAHSPNLATLGGRALPWLAALATTTPAWQITYAESDDAVPAVREAATAPGRPLTPIEPIGPITAGSTTVPVGDRLAVFDQDRLHLLDPAASVVWACVPDAAGRSDLVDVVVARATPAAARDQVRATVAHLARCRLLPWT